MTTKTKPQPDLRALRDPDRLEQLRHAGTKGVVTNMDRARLGRAVKSGRMHIARLLQEPPDCLARAELAKVLQWAPGLGEIKVMKVLTAVQVSPNRHMGKLTDRERLELQLVLRQKHPSQWALWDELEKGGG